MPNYTPITSPFIAISCAMTYRIENLNQQINHCIENRVKYGDTGFKGFQEELEAEFNDFNKWREIFHSLEFYNLTEEFKKKFDANTTKS